MIAANLHLCKFFGTTHNTSGTGERATDRDGTMTMYGTGKNHMCERYRNRMKFSYDNYGKSAISEWYSCSPVSVTY